MFVPQLDADDCQFVKTAFCPPVFVGITFWICRPHYLRRSLSLSRRDAAGDPSVWKCGLFHRERLHFLAASSGWGKVAPVNKFNPHIHRGDQLKFACYTCLWYFNELLDAKKKQYEWMLDVSCISLDLWNFFFFLLTSVHKDSFPSVFV